MSPGSPSSPLLSIVTPVRDQARFLSRCLASVRDQPPGIAEHIVMDGGSSDGSVEILRQAPGLACWVSDADRGQSHAINKGFRRARGDFGGWLNADDWYTPGALGEVAEFLTAHPETDVLVCRARFVGEDGRTVHEPTPPERIDEPALLALRSGWFAGHSIAQPEVFFRVELFRAVGGLDENNHHSMDHHLWLKLIEHGARVRQIEVVVACQGVHGGQKTADRLTATRSIVESSRAWLERRGSHWPLRAAEVRPEIEGLERKLTLASRYAAVIDRAFGAEAPRGGFSSTRGATPPGWRDALDFVMATAACDTRRTIVVAGTMLAKELRGAFRAEDVIDCIEPEQLRGMPEGGASCVVLHRVLGASEDPVALLRDALRAIGADGTVVVSAEPERSDAHDLYLKRLRVRAVNKVTQPDELIIGPRADITLRPMLESTLPSPIECQLHPRGVDVEQLASAVSVSTRVAASRRFGGFDFLPLAPFPAPPKITPHGLNGGTHDCWLTCVLRRD